MVTEKVDNEQTDQKEYTVLVAVDFSQCSAQALRRAKSIMGRKPDRILILHVIDQNFVEKCINDQIGTEGYIKKTLFLQAKNRLKDFLSAGEHREFGAFVARQFVLYNSVNIENGPQYEAIASFSMN